MNSLYIIRNRELIEIKADKVPIGFYQEIMHNYTNHEMEFYKGDIIYIFSDGFVDQFGGRNGDKFKYKRFRKLLVEIQDFEFLQQKEILRQRFHEWRGEYDQIDDVLVLGFQLTKDVVNPEINATEA